MRQHGRQPNRGENRAARPTLQPRNTWTTEEKNGRGLSNGFIKGLGNSIEKKRIRGQPQTIGPASAESQKKWETSYKIRKMELTSQKKTKNTKGGGKSLACGQRELKPRKGGKKNPRDARQNVSRRLNKTLDDQVVGSFKYKKRVF